MSKVMWKLATPSIDMRERGGEEEDEVVDVMWGSSYFLKILFLWFHD